MPSIKSWSRSLSRVEIDQSSREARLRLERMERIISRAAGRLPRLRRLLFLLNVGEYGWQQQRSRVRGPLSDRRPCRMESEGQKMALCKSTTIVHLIRRGDHAAPGLASAPSTA